MHMRRMYRQINNTKTGFQGQALHKPQHLRPPPRSAVPGCVHLAKPRQQRVGRSALPRVRTCGGGMSAGFVGVARGVDWGSTVLCSWGTTE